MNSANIELFFKKIQTASNYIRKNTHYILNKSTKTKKIFEKTYIFEISKIRCTRCEKH